MGLVDWLLWATTPCHTMHVAVVSSSATDCRLFLDLAKEHALPESRRRGPRQLLSVDDNEDAPITGPLNVLPKAYPKGLETVRYQMPNFTFHNNRQHEEQMMTASCEFTELRTVSHSLFFHMYHGANRIAALNLVDATPFVDLMVHEKTQSSERRDVASSNGSSISNTTESAKSYSCSSSSSSPSAFDERQFQRKVGGLRHEIEEQRRGGNVVAIFIDIPKEQIDRLGLDNVEATHNDHSRFTRFRFETFVKFSLGIDGQTWTDLQRDGSRTAEDDGRRNQKVDPDEPDTWLDLEIFFGTLDKDSTSHSVFYATYGEALRWLASMTRP